MKQLGYSEIVEQIENAPLTYLGGLLIASVKTCRKKRFIADDEALVRVVNVTIETDDKSAS